MTTSMTAERRNAGSAANRDWNRARLDIVNGLLRMADEALTAREAASVLRMAADARDAGLLSPEETYQTTLIADARMKSLATD